MQTMKYLTVKPDELEMMLSSFDWMAEEKLDGYGVFVGVSDGVPFVHNTDGTTLRKPFNRQILENLSDVYLAIGNQDFTLRGELLFPKCSINQGFVVAYDSVRDPSAAAMARHTEVMYLSHRYEKFTLCKNSVSYTKNGFTDGRAQGFYLYFLMAYQDEGNKRKLLETVHSNGGEGLVFLHRSGQYTQGKRVDHVRKLKFVESADLVVTQWQVSLEADVNGYAHGVAQVSAWDSGSLRSVGTVHVRSDVIAQLQTWAGPGMPILEVDYLYFTGGCLYQPIAKGVRFDKSGKPLADVVTRLNELRKSGKF